jgi:hypothetical protein
MKYSVEDTDISIEKTKLDYVAGVLEAKYIRKMKNVLSPSHHHHPDQLFMILNTALMQRFSVS